MYPYTVKISKCRSTGNVVLLQDMKVYGVKEIYLHSYLTSALDGCRLVVSFKPQPPYFQEKTPCTH
jgi:hypothetical protein